jgi:hypothetical protein
MGEGIKFLLVLIAILPSAGCDTGDTGDTGPAIHRNSVLVIDGAAQKNDPMKIEGNETITVPQNYPHGDHSPLQGSHNENLVSQTDAELSAEYQRLRNALKAGLGDDSHDHSPSVLGI